MAQTEQVLVDGGRVLTVRDRLMSLCLEMQQSRQVPFAQARAMARLVDSQEFLDAEQAAARLRVGGRR